MTENMSSTKRKLISQMRGFSPIYCIFYYTQDEKIKIFSGGKFFPLTEEENSLGGFLIPVDNREQPREEVIRAYNGLG